MSDLEKLIEKFCPLGVEYREFKYVCVYVRGITYSKSDEAKKSEEGFYKVLRANNIDLNTSKLIFNDIKFIKNIDSIKEKYFLKKGDILICAGSGSKEHIGKVAFIKEDINFLFGGFMGVIRVNIDLLPKYMFYVLSSNIFKNYLKLSLNSSTINNLNNKIMNNFKIPVPPIEVQNEIVRILDNFTELIENLEKELEARKKQYEYYRELLFTFGSEVERVELGEIATNIFRGNGITKNQLRKEGTPCIR